MQSVNFAVYSRAAALLDCNLNVSVILQGNMSYYSNIVSGKNNDNNLKRTNLCTVTEEKDSGVCGIDVDRLQLNQVVQRASTYSEKHW